MSQAVLSPSNNWKSRTGGFRPVVIAGCAQGSGQASAFTPEGELSRVILSNNWKSRTGGFQPVVIAGCAQGSGQASAFTPEGESARFQRLAS